MPTPYVSVQYEALNRVILLFDHHADQIAKVHRFISGHVSELRSEYWTGDSADTFYRDMDNDIFPALLRLVDALRDSADTTREIVSTFEQAEEEGAALFIHIIANILSSSGLVNVAGNFINNLNTYLQNAANLPTGAINTGVNFRTSPSTSADRIGESALTTGTAFTLLGVTGEEHDGHRWARIRTADGQEGWVILSAVTGDDPSFALETLPIYDGDGQPISNEKLPFYQTVIGLVTRYSSLDSRLRLEDGTLLGNATPQHLAELQGILGQLDQLSTHGINISGGSSGAEGSVKIWSSAELTMVHEGITELSSGLYSFAQAQGINLDGVSQERLFELVYMNDNSMSVYRGEDASRQGSPATGAYAFVSRANGAIVFYDNGLNDTGTVTSRQFPYGFTRNDLIGHELQHLIDFSQSGGLNNSYTANIENGNWQFQSDYEITFTTSTGESSTFSITAGQTLSEVEAIIGQDLAGSTNPDWGMPFIARSSTNPNETSIDASLAVINGNGYLIGEDYSLGHNIAGIAKQEWATQEMTDWINTQLDSERANNNGD